MISGLSHITLVVSDLERTSRLLVTVFDAQEVYSSGDRFFSLSKEKFFLIGDIWICIMEGEALPVRSYNHIAFQVRDEELDGFVTRIQAAGAEMLPGRPRIEGEGRSVYFLDYDNHMFELHTGNLADRLIRYLRDRAVEAPAENQAQ